MLVPDVNVLLYAYDSTSRHHETARTWLETALADDPELTVRTPGYDGPQPS